MSDPVFLFKKKLFLGAEDMLVSKAAKFPAHMQ